MAKNALRYTTYILLLVLAFLAAQIVSKKIKRAKRHAGKTTEESFISLKQIQMLSLPQNCYGQIPDQAAQQPYFYLGKGKQSFAFVSADGTFILKLLKNPKRAKSEKKIANLVNSFYIGASILPEETGLIYLHGSSSSDKVPMMVKILTNKGDVIQIDLQEYFYLIQERATPFKETLLRLTASGDYVGAQAALGSIFDLIKSIERKGVEDSDGALIRNQNIGFIGSRAILFDVGKLSKPSNVTFKELQKKDLKRLKPLSHWIEQSIPELTESYENQILGFFGNSLCLEES